VAKKEQLIALLREKRTALITRAVTKGIDPNVPMRDSGVEWLDAYPSHWTALPLKRWVATKITDGPHETPEFVTDGVDFISAEAVSNGRIDFDKRRGFITPSLHSYYRRKCKPVRDDILMCKSGATTGKLAKVDVDFEFSVWSPLAVVRPLSSHVLPRFLEISLGSDYVQEQIRRTWSAGTQPNISMGDLEQLFVIAPKVDEQARILDFIDQEAGGFEALIARIRDAIDRLKELRTALISAAVTGKIDVKGEAA
jgi:type I restriction enzyme S subunit